MVGLDRSPLWVTQSNPLPKQGHPEQAVQDLVQVGLGYLQRKRLSAELRMNDRVIRTPSSNLYGYACVEVRTGASEVSFI